MAGTFSESARDFDNVTDRIRTKYPAKPNKEMVEALERCAVPLVLTPAEALRLDGDPLKYVDSLPPKESVTIDIS